MKKLSKCHQKIKDTRLFTSTISQNGTGFREADMTSVISGKRESGGAVEEIIRYFANIQKQGNR